MKSSLIWICIIFPTIALSQSRKFSRHADYIEKYNEKKELISFEDFSIKEGSLIWTHKFDSKASDFVGALKENLKLKIDRENMTGFAANQALKCKSLSIGFMNNFAVDFRIYPSSDGYTIMATNIIFDNDINFNLGSVYTTRKNFNIEALTLNKRGDVIRKTMQNKRDLYCLQEYLKRLFTISSPE